MPYAYRLDGSKDTPLDSEKALGWKKAQPIIAVIDGVPTNLRISGDLTTQDDIDDAVEKACASLKIAKPVLTSKLKTG